MMQAMSNNLVEKAVGGHICRIPTWFGGTEQMVTLRSEIDKKR
jgi:hypothetical protein